MRPLAGYLPLYAATSALRLRKGGLSDGVRLESNVGEAVTATGMSSSLETHTQQPCPKDTRSGVERVVHGSGGCSTLQGSHPPSREHGPVAVQDYKPDQDFLKTLNTELSHVGKLLQARGQSHSGAPDTEMYPKTEGGKVGQTDPKYLRKRLC